MARKKMSLKEIVKQLRQDHADTLKKTDWLEDILTNLRYEGRSCFGRNLKETREAVAFFKEELGKHVKLEEKVIFPFLKKHVPRFEPIIYFLQSEHDDFKKNFKSFDNSLRALSEKKNNVSRRRIVDKLRATGTYWIYVLRNHIRAEIEGVYKVMDRELRLDEKEELQRKITERDKHRGSR